MDDGDHTRPTRDNILQAYKTLVSQSRAGDAVFCFYAGMHACSVIECSSLACELTKLSFFDKGHGSNTPDIDGDEGAYTMR